jgi:chitinase
LRGTLPCQAGYGSCSITGSPSCPYGGGSTNGRHIGYYQSWNVRNRVCNKVSPKQLNTTGYTHLFYSFASIDPVAFIIAPAHADDPAMMREFTSLAKPGLKTWIAIGGFDFSDKGTPTHKTWSELCADKTRRAAFIASVKNYMDEYGFTGVDLDWEYPGDTDRGGNKLADTRNLVLLVREMRAAYGSNYGISLTLAPDYWYLRWFDAKAMEPYVDFFGFMAYDLHGSWDADVLALGKKVRGQADIREIADNTVPLWFDGLNPAKLNFGLAMYGRGYTLADPSCNQLLCPFAKASKPAPCTNFDGVMSLLEIQQLIKRKGLTPQYLPDSMMKQITWDDQWIGYDDEETFAAKKAWADSRCFGGTMVWSIDFQVSGSGDSELEKYGEVVYIGSEVFETPTAQCPAPCVMVFPSSALPEPKVITMQPYTATLQVGTTTTTVVAVATTSTTTVTAVNFFNQYIASAQEPGAVLTLRPSFQPRPVHWVVTGADDKTTTRTILPPPLGGGLGTSSSQDGGSKGSTSGGTIPGGGSTSSTSTGTRSTVTLSIRTEFPFLPPPTRTPEPTPDDPTFTPPPGTEPPTTTPWPTGTEVTIKPVTDTNKPPPPGGSRISCKTWFFFLCISWIDLGIEIEWWDIVLPTVTPTIGPGPPPPGLIKLPTGWGWDCMFPPCTLPPWPKMTVSGGLIDPPAKPTDCEPVTATLTIQSTLYGTTTTDGTVRTTETRSFSSEFPLLGCALTDIDLGTTKTACIPKPTPRSVNGQEEEAQPLAARADDDCDDDPDRLVDVAIFPLDPLDDGTRFKDKLNADSNPESPEDKKFDSFTVIESTDPIFVAFVFVSQVKRSYLMSDLLLKHGLGGDGWYMEEPPPFFKRSQPGDAQGSDDDDIPSDYLQPLHVDDVNRTADFGRLTKRTGDHGVSWAPSHLGVPPRRNWISDDWISLGSEDGGLEYYYQRHASECEGQYVYIIENAFDPNHDAFARLRAAGRIETLPIRSWWPFDYHLKAYPDHATMVASMVAGHLNGVCPEGKVTLVSVCFPLRHRMSA